MIHQNIELLAPAGNYEAFIAAVQNGADAVYLGGNKFNARENANNFSDEELQLAIAYAHARDVKIYVTLNILFYEKEIKAVIDYVDFLYAIQVDALIMQDIGLIQLVKQRYRDFEIHASTQCSITSLQGVKFLEELGVSRVVLARENTIEEIAYICKNTSLEIEVFIHGALCVSYSGQCLMSSMIGKRSGNRGQCAQPCRMPYRLIKNDMPLDKEPVYLLSTKDLNTIDTIGELMKAGVTSFKIEGRMKRPEYVAGVVAAYKKVMSNFIKQIPLNTTNIKKELSEIFNRNFTKGYLHEPSIIDTSMSGNRGIAIGKVIGYSKGKQRVTVLLDDVVRQYDGIRFDGSSNGFKLHRLYKNGKLVNEAKSNETVTIDYKDKVRVGAILYKTSNTKLLSILKDSYKDECKKIDIVMKVAGKINQPLTITVIDSSQQLSISSLEVITQAKNNPLDYERIKKQVNKTKDTCFNISSLHIDFPLNGFISIKSLNQLRRDALEALYQKRANKQIHSLCKNQVNLQLPVVQSNKNRQIYVSVLSINQLSVVKDYAIDYLLFPLNEDIKEAYHILKSTNIELIPMLSRIMNQKDFETLESNPYFKMFSTYVVNDYGSYYYLKNKNINCLLNDSFNMINPYSLSLFKEEAIVLSPELSKQQINSLSNYSNRIILRLYGYHEDMISKHCPISFHTFHTLKERCNLCKKGQYYLEDHLGYRYPMLPHDNCCVSLLHYTPMYIDDISKLSISNYLLSFTIEDNQTLQKILNDYMKIFDTNSSSNIKKKYTSTIGYY